MNENLIKQVMLHCYVKKIVLTAGLVVCFFCLSGFTQQEGGDKANKRKQMHKAENYFDKGDYNNALIIFNELLKNDSLSSYLNYHVGVCKFHLSRYRSEALSHLELSGPKINTEIYYYLGRLYHLNMDFEKALLFLNKYYSLYDREYDDELISQLINNVSSAQTLMAKPVLVDIINMGNLVNSQFPEYVPLITADGKKIFFTSRRPGSSNNEKDELGNFYEDIYVADIVDGKWSVPKQLPEPVNSNTHDACVALTPEGENLLIYRTNKALTGGDIYFSETDGITWTEPKMLDEVINSPEWNEPSATISSSGDMIIFSSNRPGGEGGMDLYRCMKLPNGKWSQPVNLGNLINTPLDEDAPFIHPDGSKLYFSSKGHTNMGGYDIFRSNLDSSGQWGRVINMGYPLNTVDDDIYFVLSADEEIGFFSSVRKNGLGETDIYSVTFLDHQFGYIVKNGYINDQDGNPLSAKITLLETDEHKIQGIYKSNRLTGRFIFLINPDHEYQLLFEADGFHPLTIDVKSELDILQVELTKKE